MTEALKTIPGFSIGIRANSAMRTLKLNSPVCPNSQRKRLSDGTFEEMGPNCQMAGGQWWLDCQKRGHDPYFRTKVRYETIDDWDPDTGELKGSKKLRHEEKVPNVVQVALSRRMNNGQGVVDSMRNKGRRRLEEAGYAECCQFRNCQKPINTKFHSVAYGDYCSRGHLELIAADTQGVLLPQPSPFEAGAEQKIAQTRQKMLREAAWSAVEG